MVTHGKEVAVSDRYEEVASELKAMRLRPLLKEQAYF
jgi:hypothetical protein